MVTLEQRNRVCIMLHTFCVAWHQQLHEVLGGFISVRPLDEYLVNVLIIDITDGTLDEVAVGVDQHRCCTTKRPFTDFVPKAGEIIKVALDFRLRARKASGADDATHGGWQRQVRNNRLQTLTVRRAVDFTADAAAMRRIWHQNAITAGKAEICGKSSALVAALFLHNLNQQNLTAMNDVLNFVAATQVHALCTDFVAGLWCAGFAIAATTATTTAVVTAVFAALAFAFV